MLRPRSTLFLSLSRGTYCASLLSAPLAASSLRSGFRPMSTVPPAPASLSPTRTSLPFDLNSLGPHWIAPAGPSSNLRRFTLPVEQSPNDDRKYRFVVLGNGLQALLISDPAAEEKAAASLSVGIGHLSDPADLPGLAHFCEHMLFLGTERFPDEAEYKKYLSTNAGSSNAFTSLDETNYFFDCSVSALPGALSRHSQFFTTPLFKADCVEREVKAVDSEFRRNLQLDARRLFQLGKDTASRGDGSVYWKFGTGSKETLWDEPIARGVDVRGRLLGWYAEHYSANLMKLAIISNHSLDELERLVVLEYSAIPNLNFPTPEFSAPVLGPPELGKLISYRTIRDSPNLRIEFPFPDPLPLYKFKPSNYIAQIIGDEGPGSILALLKQRGLATALSASGNSGAAGFDFFRVSIALTPGGLVDYKEVITLVFSYLELLRSTSPKEWIFRETQSLGQISWRYVQKGAVASTVRGLASQMQTLYPRERLLIGPYFATEFNASLLQECIAGLVQDKCRVFLGSKDPLEGMEWDRVEQYYSTEHSIEPLDLGPVASTSQGLSLPLPNPFIPQNLDLVNLHIPAKVPSTRPTLIRQTTGTRVFHKLDDQWSQPKATAYFLLKTPIVEESVSNVIKAQLFTSLLEESLATTTYAATLASLDYSFGTDADGLQISIGGYNDKLPVLLEVVLKAIVEYKTVDVDRFKLLKDRLARAFANTKLANPTSIASGHLSHLTRQTYYTFDQRLAVLEALTPVDIEQFVQPLLANLSIEALVHGNVDKHTALAMVKSVEVALGAKLPLPNDFHRALLLPPGSNSVYRPLATSAENVNSAVVVYYSVCEATNYALTARLQLFSQIAFQPIFSILRTQEQLGYIVQSGSGGGGFKVIVQSERAGEYLDSRIEALWANFGDYLDKMTEEEFVKHRQSLITKRTESVKNLGQETSRYWTEITSGELDFYYRERDALEFGKLEKSDIIEFFARYISPSSSTRTKLSIVIQSQRVQLERSASLALLADSPALSTFLDTKPTLPQILTFVEGMEVAESQRGALLLAVAKLGEVPSLPKGVEEIIDLESYRAGLARGGPTLVTDVILALALRHFFGSPTRSSTTLESLNIMVSERTVRVAHPLLFTLIGLFGLIALGISASLVKFYNDHGYPDESDHGSSYYSPRIRIILVAAVWSTVFSVYLLVGVMKASSHILFGVASHFFSLSIGFLLFLIGTASLTALTRFQNCSAAFARCNLIKGLVGISWIETILLFVALLSVLGIGFGNKNSGGFARGSLINV